MKIPIRFKIKAWIFLFVCLCIVGFYLVEEHKVKRANRSAYVGQNAWMVYFSPTGGCTEAICDVLNASTSSIIIQVYTFTSAVIEQSLIDAGKRGVKVQLIMDEDMAKKYAWQTQRINSFISNGIPVYLDRKHKILHNKVAIIDNRIVITGSFNWTASAEKSNAENLLVINDDVIAHIYMDNWEKHFKHSTKTKKLQMPVTSKDFYYED
ncbi:MAG: phospholipase D family protein [Methanomassiliicoccales archaeon]